MNIAVISDLHLGDRSSTDLFGHCDAEFVKFLIFLENNFEKIILLGDVYECLMPRKFRSFKNTLQSVFKAHPDIISRFQNNKKYTYIHGNHDEIAATELNAPNQLLLNVDNNQNILFLHGHQYDDLVQGAKFVSEFGAYLGGWIIRFGLLRVYNFIFNAEVNCGLNLSKIKEKFEKIIKLNDQYKADIIVTGHTHVAEKSECGSRLYLNSGTCSNGKFTFLGLDTKSSEYTVNTNW